MPVKLGRPPKNLPPSPVPDSQFAAMEEIMEAFRSLRDDQDREVAGPFEERLPKRTFKDYYEVISKPVFFVDIDNQIKRKRYMSFNEFVQECTQAFHNAKLYNQTGSDVFNYAITLQETLESELKKLVENKVVTEEDAAIPDLGPIPEGSEPEATPNGSDQEDNDEQEDNEEEDEEEEEEDEEDEEDEDDAKTRKRNKRLNRAEKVDATANSMNPRRKRGRPPRVDTPMEMRIKNVIKGLRRVKDENNNSKVKEFDKLPDPKAVPHYYTMIQQPISIEMVKKRIKRREYKTFDSFRNDLRLLFSNARQFHGPSSHLYHDAYQLEAEAEKLADAELKKSEDELRDEIYPTQGRNAKDARIPVRLIEYKGESYRVGDWVHLTNPNDPSKPIVGQIHRTWRTGDGEYWVNVCWFYRPEQTVHSVYRKFYKDEVFKTGQYRDHRIEEVIEKCFVMFVTRFHRGRPKGYAGKKVYVCESRYNEDKKEMNKIKTWKSCIPDEVRGTDYEMDLFEGKQMQPIKVASPIAHLLPPDAPENPSVLPKAKMGVENAPPIVGAVYKGEKDDTPPPESPPPATPATVARPSRASARPIEPYDGSTPFPRANSYAAAQATPHTTHPQQQNPYTPSPATPYRQPAYQTPQQPLFQQTPHGQPQHQHYYQQQRPAYQTPAHLAPQAQYPQQQHHYYQQQAPHQGAQGRQYSPPNPDATAIILVGPPQNTGIPSSIAKQFCTDEEGNVLWWKVPPADNVGTRSNGGVGHSLEYLARQREIQERRAKRKAEMEVERKERAKRVQLEGVEVNKRVERMLGGLLVAYTEKLAESVKV